jgi:hypothetical protein
MTRINKIEQLQKKMHLPKLSEIFFVDLDLDEVWKRSSKSRTRNRFLVIGGSKGSLKPVLFVWRFSFFILKGQNRAI